MNKKIYTILLISIVALLSLSSASAWWIFGDDQKLEEYKQTYCKGVVLGDNTPAGKEGYHYAIIDDENNNITYITDACMDKLSWDNNQFALMREYYEKNKDTMKDGKIYKLECIDFKYEYENKTVGENQNMPVITKVYYTNGTEMATPQRNK